MSLQSFVFYCSSRFKNEKIIEIQKDYNSGLLYQLFQLSFQSKTNKVNKDVKSWYELKQKIVNPIEKEQRTDQQIEEDILEKYNKIFLNK